MGQMVDQTFPNQDVVPTANNMVQHRPDVRWNQGGMNYANALAGVGHAPPVPQGGGGTNIQQFANQPHQNPGAIAGLQGRVNAQPNQIQGMVPQGTWGAMQGVVSGNAQMVNPQMPIVQQVDPATGQPVQVPGMQPHGRADIVPNANDIINTVQPVPNPQPVQNQMPSDVAQMMSGIMGYFNQNPQAASAVFGEGGLANFQQRIGQLFQANPVQQGQGYVNSLAGQVAGRGGSVIQGLKNIFANRG